MIFIGETNSFEGSKCNSRFSNLKYHEIVPHKETTSTQKQNDIHVAIKWICKHKRSNSLKHNLNHYSKFMYTFHIPLEYLLANIFSFVVKLLLLICIYVHRAYTYGFDHNTTKSHLFAWRIVCTFIALYRSLCI